MSSPEFTMRAVSERTGLSPHVLRVWERRYGAVTPRRSESNRRLYSESEVARLDLLADLTRAGHGISQIAGLSSDQLEKLAGHIRPAVSEPAVSQAPAADSDAEIPYADEAWRSVIRLDARGLRETLERATLDLGISGVTTRLIAPLITRIGTGWETGDISIAEEHTASAVLKEFLLTGSRPFAGPANAPCLVVATPAGQLHDLGTVLVTCLARRAGWNVSLLGASLPAEEIARAVVRGDALAVALSIVYPADDPDLPGELRRLRRFLPPGHPILIGGRSATGYRKIVDEIEARLITDLDGFAKCLGEIRAARAGAAQPSRRSSRLKVSRESFGGG